MTSRGSEGRAKVKSILAGFELGRERLGRDVYEDVAKPATDAWRPTGAARVVDAPPNLESLFRSYAADVVRIVGRLLGPAATEADVDDLTQQVFLSVHRALPRFRGESQISTWIYGIAARVVLQHLRSRRRYRGMIERFEACTTFDAAPPGVEETVEQRRALRRVWSALLRMKPERRVVFVLFELEGLSASEVAEALSLGEDAVRSRLRRARTELADRLAKGKEVPG